MKELFTVILVLLIGHVVRAQSWPKNHIVGEFLIQFQEGETRSLQDLRYHVSKYGLQLIQRINASTVHVKLDPDHVHFPAQVIFEQVKTDPAIRLMTLNGIYHASKAPNDPKFSSLWGLKNRGQADPAGQKGSSGLDIGAEKAWNITTGNPAMIVAVIDTGVDVTHQDLNGNLWVNAVEKKGRSGLDDDRNGFIDDIHGYDFVHNKGKVIDDDGHGTHCAGTIGATGNNKIGVVGVNWSVKIMGVKFLDKNGSGTDADGIKAIEYAAANGAKIISASWGGPEANPLMEQTIQNLKAKGILFITAAGNESADNDTTPAFPANVNSDNVISVAAVDNRGNLADFSNRGGTTVHLAAPGVNIFSLAPKNKYATMSGTSMATPHVAGIAALVWGARPALSYLEVRRALMDGIKPLPSLSGKMISPGIANAHGALTIPLSPSAVR